ncbi:MAG TPA: dihydrodipicolinate synthase family protein [Humisphaera sp.]|jgi:dihydrodipicolinate synthase/N-acetylneuraminate lyase|nr:dihydrodipicolinate synthase family protein [Humisphaera sp.]
MELLTHLREHLLAGQVIPAHPLALNSSRKFDERRQRALTRYYVAAGAGGLAVGVHTTQFEIRLPEHGLLKPVLELASETIDEELDSSPRRFVKIAGVVGPTAQAAKEAELAHTLGYHAALLSLGALKEASEQQLIDHCRAIAEIIPIVGFYLQPAVGGRLLPYRFWRQFAEIPNAVAIKMAPFNRYQTLDVIRAVAESGRTDIALYTGNDDNIVIDLLTSFDFGGRRLRIVGGLLGHWAVNTKRAVELLHDIHAATPLEGTQPALDANWLTRAAAVTDANAAYFDAANNFAGCIAGIHEVLRRQGLLEGIWCLNPPESLSAGQTEEIDRVSRAYPDQSDDEFVRQHLDEWIR